VQQDADACNAQACHSAGQRDAAPQGGAQSAVRIGKVLRRGLRHEDGVRHNAGGLFVGLAAATLAAAAAAGCARALSLLQLLQDLLWRPDIIGRLCMHACMHAAWCQIPARLPD
jgi:Mrp family chromosome partitioning ATPase